MNLLQGRVEGGDCPRFALPDGFAVTIGEAGRAFVGRKT